jgi:hypothetical protein
MTRRLPLARKCRSGTGNSRKHGRPPRFLQGAPDSALCARPPSTRDSRELRRVLPIEERVLPDMERERGQSDQCGGASTTPPAVVADTTRRLREAPSSRCHLPSRGALLNRCYPLVERCAQRDPSVLPGRAPGSLKLTEIVDIAGLWNLRRPSEHDSTGPTGEAPAGDPPSR